MCGVSGGLGKNSQIAVVRSLEKLYRRGPDNQNSHTFLNGLTLGAARLAMTDPLPRSNQPFLNTETGNGLVFNGEIYNYKSLKSELISKGIKFHTNSDTEVVLKCLELYGPAVISKFEGMFAIAFYDAGKNELLLTRDILGKKPLFYSIRNNQIFFSSQLSVVKDYFNEYRIDRAAVSTYLHLGYVIDPLSMYENINAVNAGEIICIDLNIVKIKEKMSYIPESLGTYPSKSVHEELEEAILERVADHTNFAISLSGGMDSTLIAITARNLQMKPIAYTAKWTDSDKSKYNIDSQLALEIANKLKIEAISVEMPNANSIPELLPIYINAMQEPNANPTGISMLKLYEEIAKDGIRLVLTGDGSDEVFGGYLRHQKTNKLRNFPQISIGKIDQLIVANHEHSKLPKFLYPFLINESDSAWLYWHLIAGDSELSNLTNENMKMPKLPAVLDLKNVFKTKNGKVQNLMFKDLQLWLNMESNRKLDRISMWHSIEARSPFQSEKLINVGYHEMNKSNFKILRKKLLSDNFPSLNNLNISDEKIGFSSPLGHWLRSNPELVRKSFGILNDFFNLNIDKWSVLVNSPNEGDFRKITQLWSLVVLATWLENE